MEQKLGELMIEKRSIDYVPIAERHGKVWHLWPVWFSGDAHLATVATGVVGIALGGNLVWTAIAVVLGGALGTFFMAFHSTQGPQLGLPQMIQSRPQFGYVGALLRRSTRNARFVRSHPRPLFKLRSRMHRTANRWPRPHFDERPRSTFEASRSAWVSWLPRVIVNVQRWSVYTAAASDNN